jgi:ABC-type transporter Mla subunit MlaD
MSESTPISAQIIPFARRQPMQVPDNGQDRLRRALQDLDAAVAGQRTAVAAWRSALAELGTVMGGLGDSMQRYRENLDTLGGRVARLHAQAVQLERTADAALAATSD